MPPSSPVPRGGARRAEKRAAGHHVAVTTLTSAAEDRFRARDSEAGVSDEVAKEVGRPDGHGLFGVLDEDEDGLLCHECGWRGVHLGLHAYRTHGLSARQYKIEHGLRRSKGLVAAAVHEKLAERSAAQLAGRSGFLANRDVRKAAAAWIAAGKPLSPAGAAASAAAGRRRGGTRRRGIVVVCQECDVEFCPLAGASKRRFCTRSCASRHNRRRTSQKAPFAPTAKPDPDNAGAA